MNNSILNFTTAVLAGVLIPAIPYGLFVIIIEKYGSENFNLNPQFVAVVLGFLLLCLGGYTSGKMIGKNAQMPVKPYVILLATPGIYLGVFGLLTQIVIDNYLPKDGILALLIMIIVLILITAPFTFWGYKRNSQ